MHHVYALASMAIGVAACFFGYRLFKVILAVWGFLIGAWIVAGITMRWTGQQTMAVVAGFIGGVVVAAIAELLYLVGVFLTGAVLGYVVTSAASGAMGMSVNPILALSAAALTGFMALSFVKSIIVWGTAFNGSWGIISGLVLLQGRAKDLGGVPAITGRGALLLAWLALGLSGVVVQYAITSRGVHHGPTPPQHKP